MARTYSPVLSWKRFRKLDLDRNLSSSAKSVRHCCCQHHVSAIAVVNTTRIIILNCVYNLQAVGAASQWWSNERMMVFVKLLLVQCSLMMRKSLLMVKWVYDHKHISPSLTSISTSLTSIYSSLTSILLAVAKRKSSYAYLTIIEKLHRLPGQTDLSVQ